MPTLKDNADLSEFPHIDSEAKELSSFGIP